MDWDKEVDVVIAGTGAAGLGAALTAHANGLEPLVLDKAALIGGSTFLAGGGMWVPANKWMLADGDEDSLETALEYMEALIGDEPPASSLTRKKAFLYNVNDAMEFYEQQGLKLRRTTGYPDYFPHYPGGNAKGRGIESVIWDTNALGEWKNKLPARGFPRNLPMGTLDVAHILLGVRTIKGALRFARIQLHHRLSKLRGQKLVGGGGALASQLLYLALQRNIPVWLESPIVDLVNEDGRVVGVVAQHEGKEMRIKARKAVFLGAGGFARNEEMRQQYHPKPISSSWSSAQMTDLGDGIKLGIAQGAATQLMDEAWWGPSSQLPDGRAVFHVSERSKPGSMIVDQSAKRYFNESTDYVLAGQSMFVREKDVPAIPSWLIFDTTYRNRYPFGPNFPAMVKKTPEALVEAGYFKRADTVEELARLCDLDPAELAGTIERFNGFAKAGVDEDFHRGENAYDTYYGDPRVKPNPCLAPIAKPPFYAVALYPGDLGTKGGLVTDEQGRVLRDDGSVIEGLYASGNTTASVMGRCYPGPGVTLAPALTFAYLAMRHAAGAPAPTQVQPETSAA